MKNLLKTIILCFSVMTIFSCSSDDDPTITDNGESFITDESTVFFINRDQTVDIIVSGTFNDGNLDGNITERGFVYATNTSPDVGNGASTVAAVGARNVEGFIDNLERNLTYFVRGYLKRNDGSFFYGNEIQFSTTVDAATVRSLVMDIPAAPLASEITATSISIDVRITEVERESPIEVGIQFSENSDFTNSIIALEDLSSENFGVNTYTVLVTNLTPAITYHFRPYAKYADNTITNGGVSAISAIANKIYPESIQFTTQAQIDEFGSEGYTTVLGDVFVGEIFNTLPIYNLNGLSSLRKIEGSFALRGFTQVKDLKGLENLISLGALILQNSNLENLEELSGLKSLDSDDIISTIILNNNLSNLDGLRNITKIDGALGIENNLLLTNLSGLESLESTGRIHIWSNKNLVSLDGLSNLKTLSDNSFDVRSNESLTDYCAVKTFFEQNPNLALTTLLNAYNPTIEEIISGNCSQ